MVKNSITILNVLLLICHCFPVQADDPGVILDRRPSQAGSRQVLMFVQGPEGRLIDAGSGRETQPPNLGDSIASSRGKLTWIVEREWDDAARHRHVRYRQHYLPAQGVVSLPSEYTAHGVPMAGGVLTFHYGPENRLTAVTGAFFEDVLTAGGLALTTAVAAQDMAWWALEFQSGYEMRSLEELPSGIVTDLQDQSELELFSIGNGRDFEFVWIVPAITRDNGSRKVALLGKTGEVVLDWNPNHSAGCIWQSNTVNTATAHPQNNSVGIRNAWASPSTKWPPATHEAHFPTAGHIPHIAVYLGDDSQDHCPVGFGQYFNWDEEYTILPLPTINGYPRYYSTDKDKAGGDAIWKTHQTMTVLADDMGWDSWNDNEGPAKVVIDPPSEDSDCYGQPGNAVFVESLVEWAPRHSIAICAKDVVNDHYYPSAALDVIAHEWGHGVMIAAGFDPPSESGYSNQRQIEEGFADIMGYGVEWKSEPAAQGDLSPETADWAFSEDRNDDATAYSRRADFFKEEENDPDPDESFHQGDAATYSCATNPHLCGHRIPVAMYLAANGGENPVCEFQPTRLGCGGSEVTQMPGDNLPESIDKSADTFMYIMANLLDETIGWDELPLLGKQAAHALFRYNSPSCYNAYPEQETIEEAFLAIGYDDYYGTYVCYCGPGCGT